MKTACMGRLCPEIFGVARKLAKVAFYYVRLDDVNFDEKKMLNAK